MKNKLNLIASIFQLVIGLLAIAAFVIVALGGENIVKWVVTLLLGIAFVIMGIMGIIDYKKSR